MSDLQSRLAQYRPPVRRRAGRNCGPADRAACAEGWAACALGQTTPPTRCPSPAAAAAANSAGADTATGDDATAGAATAGAASAGSGAPRAPARRQSVPVVTPPAPLGAADRADLEQGAVVLEPWRDGDVELAVEVCALWGVSLPRLGERAAAQVLEVLLAGFRLFHQVGMPRDDFRKVVGHAAAYGFRLRVGPALNACDEGHVAGCCLDLAMLLFLAQTYLCDAPCFLPTWRRHAVPQAELADLDARVRRLFRALGYLLKVEKTDTCYAHVCRAYKKLCRGPRA